MSGSSSSCAVFHVMFCKVHELGYLLSLSSITVRIAGQWMSCKAEAPFCKKSNVCVHNIPALGRGNAMFANKYVVKITVCEHNAEMQIKMNRLLCPVAPAVLSPCPV